MVRARRALLVPAVVSLLLMAAAVGGVVAGTIAAFGDFSAAAALTCTAVLLLTLAAISAMSRAWMIGMFAAELRGSAPRLGASLRQALRKWRPLVALAGAQVTLRAVADRLDPYERWRMDPTKRTTRGMVASLLAIATEVAGYLLAPVLVIEQRRLTDAFDRVHQLHGGTYQSINAGDLGLRLVPVLVACAIGGSSVLLGLGLTRLSPTVAPWLMRGGLGAAIAFYATTASQCRAAYHTCLYLGSVERACYGSSAPPPALLARVLAP